MIPHPLKFQSAICKALGAIALRRRRAQNAEFLCTYHVICNQMTSLSQSSFSEHKSTSLRMGLMFEIAGSAKLVSQIFWWCEVAAVFGCSSVNIQNRVVKEKLSEQLNVEHIGMLFGESLAERSSLHEIFHELIVSFANYQTTNDIRILSVAEWVFRHDKFLSVKRNLLIAHNVAEHTWIFHKPSISAFLIYNSFFFFWAVTGHVRSKACGGSHS